jgi:UDP-N-acetylglucosamine--N-acetylmuramyl-(pentapeptide) pyrophosphoryl-undecaprenol N-acetylglucosamine transferase
MVGAPSRGRSLALAIAGGGTGGHVVPGLHLLDHLRRERAELGPVLWFGAGRTVEDRVFEGARKRLGPLEFERVALELEPPGGGAPSLGRIVRRALPAARVAASSLREHRTRVVLALGGYTSLPAVLAARWLGIPAVLLEINAVRGKATRFLSPFARRVVHAWPASMPPLASRKHVCFGPPLSTEFAEAPSDEAGAREARAALGFDPDRPLLLVLGGSQGALALNRFVRVYARSLAEHGIQVLHQVGPGRLEQGAEERPGVRVREYLDDVPRSLSAATVVLCRGGASTLAEVAALARPAFVVPYPHHPDRHQEANARSLGEGVEIVSEERLGPTFLAELETTLGTRGAERRERMARALERAVPRDGATRLAAEIRALAGAEES